MTLESPDFNFRVMKFPHITTTFTDVRVDVILRFPQEQTTALSQLPLPLSLCWHCLLQTSRETGENRHPGARTANSPKAVIVRRVCL